jgi:glycerol-3-phosphate dehydrogenase
MQRALVKGGLIAVGAVGGFTVMSNDSKVLAYHPKKVVLPAIKEEHVPSRREQWTKLSQGTKQDPYDVLIIGGGATGTGCALDSATR